MTRGRAYLIALSWLLPLFFACSEKKENSAPKESAALASSTKPMARFYYDLGPATVDVSGYPQRERENYKIFLFVCGTCHSAARPLNAPYAQADTWKRFVLRMHTKMQNQAVLPSQEEEDHILEFLVYDSRIRKIVNSKDFQSQQENLKKLFEDRSQE